MECHDESPRQYDAAYEETYPPVHDDDPRFWYPELFSLSLDQQIKTVNYKLESFMMETQVNDPSSALMTAILYLEDN